MEKIRILSYVVIALLGIIPLIQFSYAISSTNVTLPNGSTNCYVDYANNFFWVACHDGNLGNTDPLYKISAITRTLTATYNIDTRNNLGVSHRNFTISGITCSLSECYVGLDAVSQPDQIIQVLSSNGNVLGYMNHSLGFDGNAMDVEGNLLVIAGITGGATRSIQIIDTITMTITATYSTSIGATVVKDLLYQPNLNRIAITRDDANFQLWNTVSATSHCTLGASGTYVQAGSIVYDANNTRYYVTQDTANRVAVISNSCTLSTTYTGFGEANYSRDLEVDTSRGEIFVGTNSAVKYTIAGLTLAGGKVWEYTINGTSALRDSTAYDNTRQQIIVFGSTGKVTIVILNESLIGNQTGQDSQLTEFCSISGNEDLLACFEPAPLTGTAGLIQDNIFDIFVATGIIDGTNTNCKTNGVGYFYVSIAFGVLIGIFWVASRGDLTNIPTFIWFISGIAILGAITTIGCLDPTFFIVGILVMVALAVAKVKAVTFGEYFKGE